MTGANNPSGRVAALSITVARGASAQVVEGTDNAVAGKVFVTDAGITPCAVDAGRVGVARVTLALIHVCTDVSGAYSNN